MGSIDTVTYLLFLSGENLGHAVQVHTNWVKESVLPVIEMLNTAFSDQAFRRSFFPLLFPFLYYCLLFLFSVYIYIWIWV